MKPKKIIPADIDSLIIELRGQRVIVDANLASIYGVSTKAFNQAVKRNAARFPVTFAFRLSEQEVDELNRSQFVTGSQKHRDPRFPAQQFLGNAITRCVAWVVANRLEKRRGLAEGIRSFKAI